MAKHGLGKGLESLIPTTSFGEDSLLSDSNAQTAQSRMLKVMDIVPNPDQPRRDFNETAMAELVDSIKTHGLLQPIVVVRDGAKFKIVAGERRWRAFKIIGHELIPAIVRTMDDQQKIEASLIENLQREDLNALEVATTLKKLVDEFNITTATLGKRMGKADTTVMNIIRLLNLPEPAKRALKEGRISEGHGRAILMLTGNEQRQQQLLDYILKHGWTVHQSEQFASTNKTQTTKKSLQQTAYTNTETEALTRKLAAKTPVRIHTMAQGRGRIIIEFNDPVEYKAITKKLIQD